MISSERLSSRAKHPINRLCTQTNFHNWEYEPLKPKRIISKRFKKKIKIAIMQRVNVGPNVILFLLSFMTVISLKLLLLTRQKYLNKLEYILISTFLYMSQHWLSNCTNIKVLFKCEVCVIWSLLWWAFHIFLANSCTKDLD